ncbi:hypothetical protein P3T35_005037 [Kitasatospora sp. GP30]|nr:hypothetical protein [Kitasatospora sp. GP30]
MTADGADASKGSDSSKAPDVSQGPDGSESPEPRDPWAPPGDAVPPLVTGRIPVPPQAPPGALGAEFPGRAYPGPFSPQPARPRTNGLAVTSLITGILCCLWPAAIAFGISGLVQLRRRARAGYPQAGQGLAVAGLVLGVVGMLLTALGIVGLLNGHSSPELVQLKVGDCFRNQPSILDKRVKLTPCTAPHDGEVSGVVVLTETDFPGSGPAQAEADRLCGISKNAYVYDFWAQSSTLLEYHQAPTTRTEWDLGRHHAVCYLRDIAPDAVPRSVRCDARTLTAGQLSFLSSIRELDWDARKPADRARLQQTAKDLLVIRNGLLLKTWPPAAQGSIAMLEWELAADQPFWQTAAADTTTPVDQLYAGLAGHDPTQAESRVRAALGLTVQDPTAAKPSAEA